MSSRPSRGAARLAAILDALPDALLLVNCNGTVVNANTIALETFEAPGTALVGRGLLDLLPSFDSKRIPGSMRRRDEEEERTRTKPTRMVARRTDGTELLVEVTSANLEDGRTPYESAFEAAYADHRNGYTGNELLMLVVRDLTGTLDTETELARQQRQTEMILRAAAEGVVGVDADGKVVLVNPSAAQILGYRASELGGKELHPLIHHSRADGSALPWEDTPLADTLKSGRKHRVRGQALWAKDGRSVSVDLTTAPVRDGDQLVGAVMTFTDRRPFDALAARHTQLLAVLEQALRGPLEELKGELGTLASDPAGQLWPEANQILHHLAAGHARMTTLVDNVLSYQRLDSGKEKLNRTKVSLDGVVAAGVEGAIELIGPGRAQFAVHAPPIEATVDAERIAQALSHLIADVAGVDSTGRMPAGEAAAGGRAGAVPGDSTIVVAAAQRGDAVRIEVRGPFGGGDPVHEPIVRGIVRRHGGLMQTHEVPGAPGGGPGAGGSAYVLELPMAADGTPPDGATSDGATSGAADGPTGNETTVMPMPAARARGTQGDAAAPGSGGQGPDDEGHEGGEGPSGGDGGPGGTGGSGEPLGGGGAGAGAAVPEQAGGAQPTGRRRGRPAGAEPIALPGGTGGAGVPHGAGGDGTQGAAAPGVVDGGPGAPAPQGGATQGGPATDGRGLPPGMAGAEAVPPTGRRRARQGATEGGGLPALPAGPGGAPAQQQNTAAGPPGRGPAAGPQGPATPPNGPAPVPPNPQIPGQSPAPEQTPAPGRPHVPGQAAPAPGPQGLGPVQPGGGRRARRALAEAPERTAAGERAAASGPQQPAGRTAFALPPAAADRAPEPSVPALPAPAEGQVPAQSAGPRPGQAAPAPGPGTGAGTQEGGGTGRRRARRPVAGGPEAAMAGGPDASMPGGQNASMPVGPDASMPGGQNASMPVGPDASTPGTQPGHQLEAAANSGASQEGWDGEPSGRRRARRAAAEERAAAAMADAESSGTFVAGPEGLVAQPTEAADAGGTTGGTAPGIAPAPEAGTPQTPDAPQQPPAPTAPQDSQPPQNPQNPPAPTGRRRGRPSPAEEAAGPSAAAHRQPLPPAAEDDGYAAGHSQGRAFSVRTLGQGVPFAQQIADQQRPPLPPGSTPPGGTSAGSGRRRKLAAPPQEDRRTTADGPAGAPPQAGGPQQQPSQSQPQPQPQPHLMDAGEGRAFAISAPDEGSEGPEPLDGPNGAIEVMDRQPMPMDDELPPEPLDNPRRLLVWPAPDVATQQALSDRGYRPVIVNSREEVDAQIAAYPAALFVDPLTGPITRTALQSLRQAAGAAEVPVLVTAGLGQATREAAYGADPAVLLKALAPRDSEQHPPRVLLIEQNDDIAGALTMSLERRGMQVGRAAADADAVTLATQMRPNLVVMDLMQVRRRRAGIIDWLRANGLLDHTPLVIYTSADMDPAQLPRLAAGETVLFLAERSTSAEVQARIVDLLAKIGTN
ncbi:PAS domain-containing protein [Streptomyces sp. NPDC058773]|uniref:response regulator n=1 Tax=Streptomyces sp. NPDC058773 TaxID=3346632 RepID=UPI00369754CC